MTQEELINYIKGNTLNEPGDLKITLTPCIDLVITTKETFKANVFTYDVKFNYDFKTIKLSASTIIATGLSDKNKILALITENTMFHGIEVPGRVN